MGSFWDFGEASSLGAVGIKLFCNDEVLVKCELGAYFGSWVIAQRYSMKSRFGIGMGLEGLFCCNH